MEEPGENAPKWIVIGILVSTFLALDVVTPQFLRGSDEFGLMVMLGICIAQINLISTWAAFAPGNIVVRLPWSMLLGLLMWYALVLGFRIDSNNFSLGEAVLLGIVLLFGLVVLQIPLWIAARVFRWRLVSWDAPTIQTERGRSQFHIWHIMLGMVFLSLALAPARVVLPDGEISNMRMDGELIVLLIAMVICNIAITIPCIWGAFLRWKTIVPVALGWPLCCVILTITEFAALCALLGAPGDEEVPLLIYLLNVTQCITVFGTLLILRGLGFQLVRVVSPAKPAYEYGSAADQTDDHRPVDVIADVEK